MSFSFAAVTVNEARPLIAKLDPSFNCKLALTALGVVVKTTGLVCVLAIAPMAIQPPITRQIEANHALANFQFISQCEAHSGEGHHAWIEFSEVEL